MRTITKEELKKLYDKDFPLWAEINLELLKEKAYELVDWENLLEEIEDMARRHLDSAVSYLAVILEHLYKWDNFRELTMSGKEKGGLGWIVSVENARDKVARLFRKHPSLKTKLPHMLEEAWEESIYEIRQWLADLGIDPKDLKLPQSCPYTYEQAMTRDLRKELKP
ncbi:MAG: DUF29 domain-containing protein [Aquificaceae bacterium]|nr:DUF29 domain-containing protein [Aquificaceae bacterium]